MITEIKSIRCPICGQIMDRCQSIESHFYNTATFECEHPDGDMVRVTLHHWL